MDQQIKNNTASHGPSGQLLRLVQEQGTLRAREANKKGIPSTYLRRMTKAGQLVQITRGVYRPASAPNIGPQHGLVLVALRSPSAVVSLLSALAFHNLTTQLPSEVWITIPPKAHPPRLEWPPLRITHASGPALSEGVESFVVEGVAIQVYSAAKTVADCFKFRSRVGLDVAIEALKAYRRIRRGRMDEVEHFGQICRVARVMRPYIEAISG